MHRFTVSLSFSALIMLVGQDAGHLVEKVPCQQCLKVLLGASANPENGFVCEFMDIFCHYTLDLN